MGMGAMLAAVLRLPMTAVLVVTLLLYGNGVALLPPIIVAAVTAYIAVGWLDHPADDDGPSSQHSGTGRPAARPAPPAQG
jgi:H+/Cl- antiporter ClcA